MRVIAGPRFNHTARNALRQSLTDRSVFCILLALYFLILFPILRADRLYNDDLKRALMGHTGWDSNGRTLTTFLMKLLQCYDRVLVDISPFTQIAAIAVLALLGVMLARRYSNGSPWLAALVAFPLGAQPFFLENLSYKFDALSMSLAMLFALLPFVALKDDRRGWWIGALSLFASLNLYQPAINASLVFIVMEIVLAQLDEQLPRQMVKQTLSRVVQVGLVMLAYEVIVGTHLNGWVKRKSETIHSLGEVPLVATNFVDFYRYIGDGFGVQWWLYFGPVLAMLALFAVVVGIRYAARRRAVQPFIATAALVVWSVLLPVVALGCVLGPMLFLVHPPLVPRVLVGIGALLTAALVVLQNGLRRWKLEKWVAAVGGMLALGMCSFASVYGNALGEQKRYEERIAARLADDLADLHATAAVNAFLLDGTAGYATLTQHVSEQFPLLRSLIPTYISAEDLFHTHIFLLYFVTDMEDWRLRTDAESLELKTRLLGQTCETSPSRATQAYDLYVISHIAIVSFHAAHVQRCGTQPVL